MRLMKSGKPDMRGWSKERQAYEARAAAYAAEVEAQFEAMTDADFELVETTIDALRKRYPALHIELGRW